MQKAERGKNGRIVEAGGGLVATLPVHINVIATNSCGPSRVNHSHFWGRGEPALFWAKQAGNPEYCLAKLGSYTHAHLGCTFLHGRVVHIYPRWYMQRRRGSYICIQGRTKLLFGKFGSKGAALFLACWGSVGWRAVN